MLYRSNKIYVDDSPIHGRGVFASERIKKGEILEECHYIEMPHGYDYPWEIRSHFFSLPKGGGAIRGIGEKFAANPVTGTGSITVPIATSPGRSGFGPQLSLTYDSGAGNGPFGFGWTLSLPAITRKTDKGLPQYRDKDESDVYILSGSEDLVPAFEKDAEDEWVLDDGEYVIHDKPRTVDGIIYNVRKYRPRIEGLFARIERWTNTTDETDIFWRSISKGNVHKKLRKGFIFPVCVVRGLTKT